MHLPIHRVLRCHWHYAIRHRQALRWLVFWIRQGFSYYHNSIRVVIFVNLNYIMRDYLLMKWSKYPQKTHPWSPLKNINTLVTLCSLHTSYYKAMNVARENYHTGYQYCTSLTIMCIPSSSLRFNNLHIPITYPWMMLTSNWYMDCN